MSTLILRPSPLQTLSDWVLGTDEKRRIQLRRAMLGVAVYVAVNVLRMVGWIYGLIPGDKVAITCLYDLIGITILLMIQRVGWSARFKDPSMTLPQILFGLSSVTLSYALIEVSRGAALQLMCLILVFGMYRLSPKQIFFSGLLAVIMLVTTLFALWRWQSQSIDIGQQSLNIALAAFILPIFALVGQQVSLMRRKQIQQGKDLAAALKRLEELAMRDALTGLINRRCMLEMLSTELKRSQRTGQRFCLAMVDIDFFKRVNDTYGHQAGDAVLVGLAQDSSIALRKTDVLARWGGEEFLLLLPQTTLDFAKIPLSRLGQLLAAHDWANVLPAGDRITVSIGLAESDPSETLDALIARADQALYEAKAGGRDRICVAAHAPGAQA